MSSESQTLKGEWDGIFITADSSFWDSISLNVEWVNNTYVIKSYSKGKDKNGKDTTIVCRMDYKLISHKDNPQTGVGAGSIVLFEKEIISPIGILPGICVQTMELNYVSGWYVGMSPFSAKEMSGIWYCNPDKNVGKGFIRFEKRSK